MTSPFGVQTDRAIANIVWKTVAINMSAVTGDQDIHVVTSGTRFVCPHLFVHSADAANLTFKSGANAITGAIPIAAEEVHEFYNDGFPIFNGQAIDEDFVVNLSGTITVQGFAVIGEL